MEIKPVDSYEQPNYGSFVLKNGLKLSAGVAATAVLMGMLSGCSAVEQALGRAGFPTKDPTTIEVLDGDMPAPTLEPPGIEMIEGEFAALETSSGAR